MNPQPLFRSALPAKWRHFRKIDAHMHVPGPPGQFGHGRFTVEDCIDSADRLGIDQMVVSVPIQRGCLAPMEQVRACNDAVLEAMRRFPDRFLGYCFVIPGYEETVEEIDRCLDAGMVGVKLYDQYQFSDPVVFPIAEKAIARRVPILGHAGHLNSEADRAVQPGISDASHFCALAARYPELMLIEGHIGGGGDWEWSVKVLRDCPNVFLDTSGSVVDDRLIEMCVAEIGHQRLLFATDMSMEAGVGKILSAALTEEQAEDIWWRNMQGILDRRA